MIDLLVVSKVKLRNEFIFDSMNGWMDGWMLELRILMIEKIDGIGNYACNKTSIKRLKLILNYLQIITENDGEFICNAATRHIRLER